MIQTKKSDQLRKRAADALRDSRAPGRPESERKIDRDVAAAYKSLADNEAWLRGEKPRRPKQPA